MSGWITEIGVVSDFEERLTRFEKIFSVNGVPGLRVEKYIHTNNARTIMWAWNNFRVPDVYVKETDEGVCVVLCGAITDLGHFCSLPSNQESTATQVLRLWLEHKDNLIKELNGSFSCLFYEPGKDKATLYADRFASRSVWFTKENDVWIVGNFPSAITAMRKNNPKIDPAGLWSLFHTGRHVSRHGLYSQTDCLLAGEKAILSKASQPIVSKWIQRRYIPDREVKMHEWGAGIANVLQESSRRYKRVCRAPHIFLSGGLDSRIAAAAFDEPMKSVSFSSIPNAETRIASVVSKVIGIEHQRIIRSPYWYLDTFDAAALISAGNFLTCHTHFIVPASDIASQNADAEFFLGDLLENFNKHYFQHPNRQSLVYEPQNLMGILHSYVPYTMKDTNRLGIHFREHVRQRIESIYRDALEDYAKSLLDVSEDDADRMDTFLRWADVSITPTFNMITCLRTLAGERNIFLDNEVNEISLKIPSALRGAGILHRWTLYHLNKILPFIPDANTFLPPIVPNPVATFAKKLRPTMGRIRRGTVFKPKSKPVLNTSGSWIMMHEMYRKDPQYRGKIEEIVNDENIFPAEIFDNSRIKKTLEEYVAGNISLHIEINALLSFGILNRLLPCSGIEL